MRTIHVSKIIAFAVLLLMGYIIYMNSCLEENNLRAKLGKTAEWMELQATIYFLVDNIEVQDTANNNLLMTGIADDERMIGIYANDKHSSHYWMEAVDNLLKVIKSSSIGKPFILIDDFNSIDVLFGASENLSDVPIYELHKNDNSVFGHLTRIERPFFFFLSKDGIVSSVFFYDEVMMPVLVEYFRKQSMRENDEDTLEIPHPIINLGYVSRHMKIPLRYKLTNMGADECNIVKIQPINSCIVVNDGIRCIEPGQTITIEMELDIKTHGKFKKNVYVFTDMREEPYLLSVIGNCE